MALLFPGDQWIDRRPAQLILASSGCVFAKRRGLEQRREKQNRQSI